MKVWMRGRAGVLHRLAGAVDVERRRPAPGRTPPTFLTRLAISDTASKSPSEAIGKPASMMSTPISSRKSATSQLLLEGHGGAGALLAVAQGGVEDEDAVGVATLSVHFCGSVLIGFFFRSGPAPQERR